VQVAAEVRLGAAQQVAQTWRRRQHATANKWSILKIKCQTLKQRIF
jgi:hypothetical protein